VLKNSKKYFVLKKKWTEEWKKEVVDIFLFGSAIKGKDNPNDIDICLIFRDKLNLDIIKKAGLILGEEFHLSSLTANNFFTEIHSLSKTIMFEGRSIITGKSFTENFGLSGFLLYSYNLSPEAPSKKVRFVYLLRGRGESAGMVKRWGGEFISPSAFMVPVGMDSEVQQIFNVWKIHFKRRKLLLMD